MSNHVTQPAEKEGPARRRSAGLIVLVAFGLALALVGVLLGTAWMMLRGSSGGATAGSAVQLEIKPGSGTAAIAEKLESTRSHQQQRGRSGRMPA